jgi:hypothetical protein
LNDLGSKGNLASKSGQISWVCRRSVCNPGYGTISFAKSRSGGDEPRSNETRERYEIGSIDCTFGDCVSRNDAAASGFVIRRRRRFREA